MDSSTNPASNGSFSGLGSSVRRFSASCPAQHTRLSSAFADTVHRGFLGEGNSSASVGSTDFYLVLVGAPHWTNSYPSNLGNRIVTLGIFLLRV